MGKPIQKLNPDRQRTRYSKEFKLEAVRLLERSDKPASQLAAELGIRRNQLYKWQAELSRKGQEVAFQGSGRPATAMQAENARLKRELAKVIEERDILKKAAAYFAKELG
jgi:transposase